MIEVSTTLVVNDGTLPALHADDVWAGLLDKADNPTKYVPSITSCAVVDRFVGGLVRDIIHAGQPVREVITFHPKKLVHFQRTHGIARGTIDNEIGEDDGALTLTFRFRIAVDGIDPGSPEEYEFARHMQDDYLDAVHTTLNAVRERVAAGEAVIDHVAPASGPEFIRDVFARVDSGVPVRFAALFAPDGTMVFGNSEPMVGPAAIEDGIRGFFGTIDGLSHRLVGEWHEGGTSVAQLETTYDRKDGTQVTVPVVSIIRRRDDGFVQDYRVYLDLSPVFA
jgi:ketosteroid isomerase-like protein